MEFHRFITNQIDLILIIFLIVGSSIIQKLDC